MDLIDYDAYLARERSTDQRHEWLDPNARTNPVVLVEVLFDSTESYEVDRVYDGVELAPAPLRGLRRLAT